VINLPEQARVLRDPRVRGPEGDSYTLLVVHGPDDVETIVEQAIVLTAEDIGRAWQAAYRTPDVPVRGHFPGWKLTRYHHGSGLETVTFVREAPKSCPTWPDTDEDFDREYVFRWNE